MKPRKDRSPLDDKKIARALAAEDMTSLECILEGLMDNEILARIALPR